MLGAASSLVSADARAQGEAQARDGFYLDVHAGPSAVVNGRDDGIRGSDHEGVEGGYFIDGGVALGAAARPGLALAGQVGVLGGQADAFTMIGHGGPMIDWFPGRQRTWHLQAGAGFALGWFGGGSEFNELDLPSSGPPDDDLLGAAAFLGGGAALSGSVAAGLFVRTTGVALFGDDTRYFALVIGGGVDLMLF